MGRLGVLIAMLAVGCGFAVVIGAGFMLHHQRAPDVIAQAFWPALAILIAIVVGVAIRRPWGWGEAPGVFRRYAIRRKSDQDAQAWREARTERLATLARDPQRRMYGALIEAGEAWSDEQIDYDRHPDWLMTCPHLQPVEKAMRQAGLKVKLMSGPQVRADCRIDDASLRARFKLPTFVAYTEFYIPDRAEQDNPNALIGCNLCHSSIHTTPPDYATAQTRWFPQD